MLLALLALIALLLPSLAFLSLLLYITTHRAPRTTSRASLGRSAAVVVLGDVARSPRMCYHVQSLAHEGWKVALVGYGGTALPSSLHRSSIKPHYLSAPPAFISRLPRVAFLLVAPFKVLWQSAVLFWEITARIEPPPELILVQTPPALPTLFIVRLASLLLGSRVIIDWHNLGYTILALRMGASSPLVSLARLLERWTGRSAYAHLFVTRAMMQHLDEAWGLKGRKVVLHDRPPQHFRRSNVEETHALWTRLAPRISPGCDGFWPSFEAQHSSPFTTVTRSSGGEGDMQEAELRQDRPALVVSSTSWTADEDFSLLLRAASLYERRARELAAQQAERARASSRHASPTLAEPARAPHARSKGHSSPTLEEPEWHGGGIATRRRSTSRSSSLELDTSLVSGNSNIESTRDRSRRASADLSGGGMPLLPNEPAARLPKMLLVVTGKGELRAQYEREIALLEREEKWEYVRIRTAWLEMEEYPVLLGSADVGISLHTSSSGLDLPMKVVDMLGCALPVCALHFACLDELIQHERNGLVFRDAEELARQLESVLALHPHANWLAEQVAQLPSPFDALPTTPSSPTPTSSMTMRRTISASPPCSPLLATAAGTTLLASPVLGSLAASSAPPSSSPSPREESRTATWAGNWCAVVRPLLLAADAEDASAAASACSRTTSKSKRHAHRRTATLTSSLFRAQQASAIAARSSPKLDAAAAAGHMQAFGSSARSSGEEHRVDDGADDADEATASSGRAAVARDGLYQRRAAAPARRETWEKAVDIPDIHVSAPPAAGRPL